LHASIGIPDSILNLLEQGFNQVLKVHWSSNLDVIVRKLSGIDETLSCCQVHQHFECEAICILEEVVFRLGGIHIITCLQDDALEGLIHIDTVGVDAPELIMKARHLGSIHGVGSSCNGGGAVRLCPGRCRYDRVFHLSHYDAQMSMSTSTSH
jgi:hypothetical protein